MFSPRKHKKQTILKPIMVVLGIVCLAALILGILEATNVTHFIHRTSSPGSGPTPAQAKEQAKVDAQQKQQGVESPRKVSSTPPVPDANSISFSVQPGPSDTMTVFTNVGSLSDGTCTLDATNGAKHNNQTASVIYQPQYSTCAGFSIPISTLGNGTWTLKLTVTSNGVTTSKTITQVVQ